MSPQRVIALLGRRDQPTDALEEYSRLLAQALLEHDCQTEIRRVPWEQHGWSAALQALRLQARSWREVWVLVQYTALAWSARGFPQRFLTVLRTLRRAGARIGVVFHDAEPFGGARVIDRLRRASQIRVMRRAIVLSDRAVFTVPPEKLSWPSAPPENSCFIVVGANLPQPLLPQDHEFLHEPPCVAVYSITGGAAGDRETQDIINAVRLASEKLGRLKLLVFGRHAEVREAALRQGLSGASVELTVEGVLEGDQLVQRFAAADVLLFLRGTISSRRSSAIAGISCGLPVVALQGRETAAPLTEAGVVLLSAENVAPGAPGTAAAEALCRVLSDLPFRNGLVARSLRAHEQFFSWPAIARCYLEFLR